MILLIKYGLVVGKVSHEAGPPKVNGDVNKPDASRNGPVAMEAAVGNGEVKVENNVDSSIPALNIGFMSSTNDVIPGLDLPIGSSQPVATSVSWDNIVSGPGTCNAPSAAPSTVTAAPSQSVSALSATGSGRLVEDEDEYDDEDSLGPLEMAIIKQKLPGQGKSVTIDEIRVTTPGGNTDTVGGERLGGIVWSPLDQDTGLAGAAVTLPAAEPMFSDSDEEKPEVDTSTSVRYH